MRIVPSVISAEVTNQVTTPVYLIELSFVQETGGTEIVRVSSRQQIDVDGDVFTETNPHLKVNSLSAEKVNLEVNNPDALMLYYTLNSEANDGNNTAKVYIAYGTSSTLTYDDVILAFDGIIDEVPSINKNIIQYNCVAGSLPLMWTPRIRIGPPLCNHIPVDGTVIGNIVLERK